MLSLTVTEIHLCIFASFYMEDHEKIFLVRITEVAEYNVRHAQSYGPSTVT